MTPPTPPKNVSKIHDKPTAKAEPAPMPATPEVTADPVATPVTTPPKKADENSDRRAFTVMIPAKSYTLLGLIARVEDKSISEVILDAIERAGLKERARSALAALSDGLGE